jgi:small conductance mechanosensitive channel
VNQLVLELEKVLQSPTVASAIKITFTLLLALVAVRLTERVSARIDRAISEGGELGPTEGEKRRRAVSNVVRYSINTLIVAVALIMILYELGLNIGPMLASAGIAGIVVGLGAQNIVQDFLAGIFVLVENQYGPGDWVSIGGVSGTVEKVTLRMTQLRDVNGSVHVVPNGKIDVVTNKTKEWSRALLDVGVAYKEDVDRVIAVLKEVGAELQADPEWSRALLEPMEVLGVQNLGESSVDVRIYFKTLPDRQWKVGRELRRRIKNRFDADGIEIPFPHRTVYVGTGDQGRLQIGSAAAPPMPADED